MARPRKLGLDEQIEKLQKEYIQARKKCDELAKEIDRLANLRQEALKNELFKAIEKSGKSYEEVLAFINSTASENG